MKFFKKLFCRHLYEYESQMMVDGGMGKVKFYKCKKCGKVKVYKI